MSTKTNFKRVALVAVASLGLGVLTSVAPANAAIGDFTASTTFGSSGVITAATSGTEASPGTTGVLNTGGYVSWTVDAINENGDNLIVTVSGGTVATMGLGSVSSDGSTFVMPGKSDGGAQSVELRFTPKTAGTNMVIKSYDDADGDLVIDTGEATAKKRLAYNVYTAGLSGVVAAANSRINLVDAASTTYTGTADTLYANVAANGAQGLINIKLYDGLGSVYSKDDVSVTASVKSGDCLVGASGLQTLTFVSVSTTSGEGQVFTAQNTTNAPTVCTVEISVDGKVAATKTVVHQGAVASIEVTDVEIADSGASAQTGLGYVVAKDAAGNSLGYITLAEGTGTNGVVNTITFTNSNKTGSGSTSVNTGAAPSSVPTSIGWTCSGVKGSATMTVKHTPSNGVAIHSKPFTANCNGDAVNYKASFDKASYVPGDIATLTITATDSAGKPANDQEAIGTATTYEVGILGSNMTAVSAPTNAHTFTNGVKTYKFIVGATEGSYQMSVDLPKFNSTTYSQSAITVPYSIKASSSAVSNADVLKAIVSLIASINKQIAALQKALLKK